jgi:hypothetical protein
LTDIVFAPESTTMGKMEGGVGPIYEFETAKSKRCRYTKAKRET